MSVKLTFCGAAGDVTGSATWVESEPIRFLVDCGLFQGGRAAEERNGEPFPFEPASVEAVLLTHAHLDHCGRLPLLVKRGFQGPILATAATRDLAGLILRDSVKVQENDLARINRRRERAGLDPAEPLYSLEHVARVLEQIRVVEYDHPVTLAPGVTARFVEAGHMLGSSSIDLHWKGAGRKTHRLVFSGDLGPRDFPILREGTPLDGADLVVMESTYGDRDHRPYGDTLKEFREIIRQAVEEKGKILVPAFAVGRTQQILCHLAVMFEEGFVDRFPIYLDSPMAIEATRIYRQHPDLYDDEASRLREEGVLDRQLKWVRPVASVEESKSLNEVPGPCLIMAGSGMCTAGRILHHLRQNLWKKDTHVILVGYQTQESLGRRLVDGSPTVTIFGDTIAVKGRIHTLNGFSAHAGQTELLEWLGHMARKHPRVILNHGEDRPRSVLASRIRQRWDLDVIGPQLGESVEWSWE